MGPLWRAFFVFLGVCSFGSVFWGALGSTESAGESVKGGLFGRPFCFWGYAFGERLFRVLVLGRLWSDIPGALLCFLGR